MKEDTQKLLGEANEGIPLWIPSEEEVQRMHKLSVEAETFTEGRTWPTRNNRDNE
jgi:hypothetical protein